MALFSRALLSIAYSQFNYILLNTFHGWASYIFFALPLVFKIKFASVQRRLFFPCPQILLYVFFSVESPAF